MTLDFNHIYNQYKHQLFGFIYNMIQNKEETEDMVAECFVKLWNRCKEIGNEKRAKSFLFTCAKNSCMDYFDHKKVITKSQKELAYLLQNEDYVLCKIIETEVLAKIYKEIECLPTQCRKIFKMIYFEGMSNEYIAWRLSIKESTVRHQKARGLKLIKIKMYVDQC